MLLYTINDKSVTYLRVYNVFGDVAKVLTNAANGKISKYIATITT